MNGSQGHSMLDSFDLIQHGHCDQVEINTASIITTPTIRTPTYFFHMLWVNTPRFAFVTQNMDVGMVVDVNNRQQSVMD
jgi:hypothetical protein